MILRFIFFFIIINNAVAVQTMSAINIYSKEEVPVSVAIVNKLSDNSSLLESIAKIINEDLNSIARFKAVHRNIDNLPNGQEDLHLMLNNFTSEKIDNVVLLSIATGSKPNFYVIKISLYDIFSAGTILEKKYEISSTGDRKVAHIIADAIMLSLIGYEGDFNTKLVYIDEFNYGQKNAIKKLAVVDRDGYNQKDLASSSGLAAINPVYSSAKKSIFYSDMTNGTPRINMLDIVSGEISDLSKTYPSLVSYKLISPGISADGNNLAFTILQGNNANIYNLDFTTGQFVKLTAGGLNVSSSFSPDGTHIAYTSNVGGKPAIYVMSSNGWNPHRITFELGHYMEPSWSPDGQWIAFTRILKNVFSIGIIRPDGRDERILYSGYDAEGPSWSPSSTQIAFSFRTKTIKKFKIKIIDLKGRELRILDTSGSVSDINWIKI